MVKRTEVGSTTIARVGACFALAFAACCLAAPDRAEAQGWPGYGRDPQHSCLSARDSQAPQRIRWKTTVDHSIPPDNTQEILIHYGTPVITRVNTVIVPVKTSGNGDYQVEARRATDGTTLWTSPISDYALPSHSWVPVFGMTLTPKDRYLAYPGGGGTVFVRNFPNSAAGTTTRYAFYGPANYLANPSAFQSAIQICTPISSDALGNLYFGYVSTGVALPGYPNGIPGGLARISSTGVGSFVAASTLANDGSIHKVAYNCAPAFSLDGGTLYVAVNNSGGKGYLCAVNPTTLAPKTSQLLYDPSYANHSQLAFVDDDGSATPTVGPDGHVYYGVLGAGISSNNYRGFLLHFDGTLATEMLPSAFGWDDTASIVPASAIPSYKGSSTYLLMTKYNDYADANIGQGINKLAVVDPGTPMNYTPPNGGSTLSVMSSVLTVTGITPDPHFQSVSRPNAVREWCINSAAIDPVKKCAVVNSEDGHLYRWDFTTNSLSYNPLKGTTGLMLEPSTAEAYTPTVIGPDGAVYAINNAVLFSCVEN